MQTINKDTIESVWYKEPWCLFILGILLVTFISGIYFVNLAFNLPHDLVKDDYYKEGKAINKQIEKLILAKQLDLKANLSIDSQTLRLDLSGNVPQLPKTLILDFIHPTLSQKDFTVTLTATGMQEGLYEANLPITIENKWYLDLYTEVNNWKMKAEINHDNQFAVAFTSR